ncbi:Pleckstrin [Kalmanozyma brasiliensis GHG001]|uniref:Uncharacterized protein n=1 Tax=Kalmanozyma brasiliensis (strain GHG001) TaxID=1365824 RepID=V5EQX1_KALBG|nr:Pleckstrin [Kalmanozyma brasiliensis GHG001]EST05343.1 Pleckstrin [Kalmanozyma brasiliensis GHG001]
MAAIKSPDRVWALHDFEAENPDEVSFKAGECIIVVEKDDEYGDGWWQGTNENGHTGLFPFTYTTVDRNVALSAQSGTATPVLGAPQGAAASTQPGVMHSTMADIDNALTEFQAPGSVNGTTTGVGAGAGAVAGAGAGAAGLAATRGVDSSSASFTSDRSDVDAQSDNYGGSADDFASRPVAARAALAANAQKDLADDAERQKQEQQRMRAEAQQAFEQEEARQRELLLEKEKERQAKLAAGELDLTDEKSKAAPIDGVDMSDESDSEGSVVAALNDFQDNKTHSPLFGNLASTPTAGVAAREIQQPTSNLQGIAEDQALSQPATQAPAEAALPSPLASNDSSAATAPEPDTVLAPAIAAGVGAVALGGVAAASSTAHAVTGHEPSADASSAVGSSGPAADESVRSVAGDSIKTGTGTGIATGTGTAATSIGTPTLDDATHSSSAAAAAQPKSFHALANLPSDPTEWNVDHVVEWARFKGWDEAAVVSKFREHEISGDVLLEMDINILKEIDINAFGKRFQVANGIKELRAQTSGAPPTPGLSQPPHGDSTLGSPAILGGPGAAGSAAATPTYSPHLGGGSNNGSNADGRSLSARMAETSLDPGYGPPSNFNGGDRDRDMYNSPNAGLGPGGFGGPAGVAAWQAQQAGQRAPYRHPSEGMMRGSGDVPVSPGNTSQFGLPSPRYFPTGGPNEDRLGALPPPSPRKRESSGSALSEKNNRTSFFGLGQRNRKPPPAPAGGASSNGHDDDRSSKGTLSRLGFARASRNISSQSSQSNIRDQISLPTDSPRFDTNGDTARRQRQSTSGGTVLGAATGGMGMPANARPTSVGSAGADVSGPGAGGPAAPPGAAANGPVMSRIQPVDLEGWIKKKGERYNSWKPRYLALKGPDLVILRDPRAEKIKGYVNMKGYKVIADENTNPGKYGFKILHESEKPHYFSSDDPILVREWMKALMKSTIGRDHSFPVISSYNNATISLKEAQRMNPPPRPPSPTSRARTQRAKARPNPEQLTARDAAILMNLTSGQQTKPDDV